MTKRIFRAICLVAVVLILASMGLTMGALYGYFNEIQHTQLKLQTDLAAQGIAQNGLEYVSQLDLEDCRITWIAADGRVLYDSQTVAEEMENHLARQEIAQALEQGWGESVRYSSTLTERMLYYAERLPDGSVVRLSMMQDTVLQLVLGMVPPILLVFGGALVLSLALANRLTKKIMEPLNKLNLDEPLANEAYAELAPVMRRIDIQQRLLSAKSASLKRKQEEFSAVTGNMREGLVLLGQEDTILSINPAAAKVLGAQALIGRDIQSVEFMPQIRALLNRVHAGIRADATVTIADRDYLISANPVFSENSVSGVVLLIFDVTERARAEQLRREFTANVSHELRTPLHTISGYAELMAGGLVRQEDMAGFAQNIYSETQRMIHLVEDIIHLSQLDEGAQGLAWEQVDLYALAAREVESLGSPARQAQVHLHLAGEKAELRAIPQLLAAVVHNLCDNAIKYNRPGGRVDIRVEDGNTEVVLTVWDNGIGIPQESQARVFERFYRVDKSRSKEVGGTGLGLSIVKHAVLVHNGRIDLQSNPGQGTLVTVRIPK